MARCGSRAGMAGVLGVVVHRTAEVFDVDVRDLRFGRRTEALCVPRHAAFWTARELGLSYHAIARVFGPCDHTTVIHGVRRHRERLRDAGGGDLGRRVQLVLDAARIFRARHNGAAALPLKLRPAWRRRSLPLPEGRAA